MTKLSLKNITVGLSALVALGAARVAHADDLAPKFSALLQTWFLSDDTTEPKTNFRLRRAELRWTGTPVEKLSYFVMLDPSKTITNTGRDKSLIQDLGVSYRLIPGLDLTMGQFKTRTSAEGLAPTAELPLPDRSVIGRFFGDRREPGAMLAYKLGTLKAAVMLSNGQGASNADVDAKKDLTARVDYQALESLSVGVFTLASNFSYNTLGQTGLNVGYVADGLSARFETGYQSGKTKSFGFMADAAYAIDAFTPVLRYEQLKPNDAKDVIGWVGSAGVNYSLDGKNTKIQAAYSYLHNITATNGTAQSSKVADGKKSNVFIIAFQAGI